MGQDYHAWKARLVFPSPPAEKGNPAGPQTISADLQLPESDAGLFRVDDFGYSQAMQENTARHPLVVPVVGAAFALAAIALLVFALMGWATQGAEMFRALSAAGLSWCM